MEISQSYSPQAMFAAADGCATPRVFIGPQRYVQGEGVLAGIGRYLSLLRARRVAILISTGGERRKVWLHFHVFASLPAQVQPTQQHGERLLKFRRNLEDCRVPDRLQ